MSKEEYARKLKDPRWQKKRLEIFERDEWMCRICGDSKSTLMVHHKLYDYTISDPWNYANHFLVTLCENCHKQEHEDRPALEKELSEVLRYKFINHKDLNLLFDGFLYLQTSVITAHVLQYALKNQEIMKMLHDKYLEDHKEDIGNAENTIHQT